MKAPEYLRMISKFTFALIISSLMAPFAFCADFKELAQQNQSPNLITYDLDVNSVTNNDLYLIPVSSKFDLRLRFENGIKTHYPPEIPLPPELKALYSSINTVELFCHGEPTKVTNARYFDQAGKAIKETPVLIQALSAIKAQEDVLDIIKNKRCKRTTN